MGPGYSFIPFPKLCSACDILGKLYHILFSHSPLPLCFPNGLPLCFPNDLPQIVSIATEHQKILIHINLALSTPAGPFLCLHFNSICQILLGAWDTTMNKTGTIPK